MLNLDIYEGMVKTIPEVERKGKTMPYTSLNGNMFSFLDKKGNIALRLSKEEREKYIGEYKAEFSVQYGAIMKEYINVPSSIVSDSAGLAILFQKSYTYALTLKPKSTKKK